MKDRTPAEIDEMFEIGLPARKFKQYSSPSVDAKSALEVEQ